MLNCSSAGSQHFGGVSASQQASWPSAIKVQCLSCILHVLWRLRLLLWFVHMPRFCCIGAAKHQLSAGVVVAVFSRATSNGFVGNLIPAFVVTPGPGSQCHSGCVELSRAVE
jgi:hypothetical protein